MLKILRAFHLVNLAFTFHTLFTFILPLYLPKQSSKKKKFPRDLTLRKGYWQFGHPHLTLISLQPH